MKMLHLKHYFSEYAEKRPACGLWRAVCYFRAWEKVVGSSYHPPTVGKPWINYPATDFLASKLQDGQSVFEYGSGGSTIFFLDKGLRVTTVEHDSKWHEAISAAVSKRKLNASWKVLLHEPNPRLTKPDPCEWANPDAYVSSSRHHRNQDFANYVKAIDQFSNECFDLVMIDGRARPSCVKHAASKVSRGGLLLIDNTERTHYITSQTLAYLKDFCLVHDCYGPTAGLLNFTRTTIWQRGS